MKAFIVAVAVCVHDVAGLLVAPTGRQVAALTANFVAQGHLSAQATASSAKLNVARASEGVFAWTLDNIGNRQFVMEIELGGQKIVTIPDTGSFNLMVTSKSCPETVCDFPRGYDPAVSTAYTKLNGTRGAIFGSGKVMLQAARDELMLPGFGPPRSLEFWEITMAGERMSELWKSASFQAVLGLSWRDTSPNFTNGETSSVEITTLEAFDAKSFTVCLGKIELLPNQPVKRTPSFIYWAPPGVFTLPQQPEGVPPPKPLTYLEVYGDNHWSLRLRAVTLKHLTEQHPWPIACHDQECAVLIDTGSSVVTAPWEAYASLSSMIGQVNKDCNNFILLPDIIMTIVDKRGVEINVTITPDIYVNKYTFNLWGSGKVMDSCRGRLMPHDAATSKGYPMWILGVPFLQHYMVEFDRTTSPARVGIGSHPGLCPGPSELPSFFASPPVTSVTPQAPASVASPGTTTVPRPWPPVSAARTPHAADASRLPAASGAVAMHARASDAAAVAAETAEPGDSVDRLPDALVLGNLGDFEAGRGASAAK